VGQWVDLLINLSGTFWYQFGKSPNSEAGQQISARRAKEKFHITR